MKRFLIILAWVAFAVLLSTASWAEDPMETAVKKFIDLFVKLKPIVYVCGAFGLLSIATAAFFGKMDWSRLTFVGLALMFLAMAGAIVDYLIGNEQANINGQSFATLLGDTDPTTTDTQAMLGGNPPLAPGQLPGLGPDVPGIFKDMPIYIVTPPAPPSPLDPYKNNP